MALFENPIAKNEKEKEGEQEKFPPVREITFYAVEKDGKVFFVWEGSLHLELINLSMKKKEKKETDVELKMEEFPKKDSGIKYFKRVMLSETLAESALNFFLMQKGRHNLKQMEEDKPSYSFNFNLSLETKREIEELYQKEATPRELTAEEKEKILELILESLRETKEKKELDEKEEKSLLISIEKAREEME